MIVSFVYDWDGLLLDCSGEFFPSSPGSRVEPPEADCFDLHSAAHQGDEVPVFDAAVRHINRDGSTSWYELAELIIERGLEIAREERAVYIEARHDLMA